MTRLLRKLPTALCVCAAAMLVAILALQTVGQSALSAYYQNLSKLSNLALLPAALAAIALLFYMRKREQRACKDRPWLVLTLFVLMLSVQFLIVRSCWFTLAWDAGSVHITAQELAQGKPLTEIGYFDLCPNNAPLAIAQAIPMWFAVKLGMAVPYVVLPYINAVLLNLSAYFSYACVRRLTKSPAARLFALVVSIGWIALSPYLIYPYTDTYSILFPVLALYVWLTLDKPVWKWFLVSLLCFFGASFKPTVLIFLIALICLSVCQALAQGICWKRGAAVAMAILIGMLPGRIWQNQTTAALAQSAKPEGQLSATHYLMIGLSSENYGGHSPADVIFSQSFPTLKERQAANLAKAWERVSERGVLGNMRFFAIKAYKAYADGSFASHSSFLEQDIPKRSDGLSVFLRSFYHKRGAMMPYAQTVVQCLWLCILALCAVCLWRGRRKPLTALLAITLLGLTAYLLLFEVWPRYLFLYAPFFVILSALALDEPLSFKR